MLDDCGFEVATPVIPANYSDSHHVLNCCAPGTTIQPHSSPPRPSEVRYVSRRRNRLGGEVASQRHTKTSAHLPRTTRFPSLKPCGRLVLAGRYGPSRHPEPSALHLPEDGVEGREYPQPPSARLSRTGGPGLVHLITWPPAAGDKPAARTAVHLAAPVSPPTAGTGGSGW